MPSPAEGGRAGLDYLDAVTVLLDRIRTIHPTAGLYEAAELQWWWGQLPRVTDDLEQLFWFDDQGRPEAAVIVTDWGEVTQADPLVLPDATPEWIAHVMGRGLDHARTLGFDTVQLEVDGEDDVLRSALGDRGFTITEQGLVESWLAADARPPVSPLPDGYRLCPRSEATDRPHHMINQRRNHTDPEPRLSQASLYRPDLDLVIYDDHEAVAAYGLFWSNPTTGVGVVEPMRTEDDHHQRGLARHLLTSGIDRLARTGATRIKVCFEPDNPAARHLYLGAGFQPDRENDIFTGPTTV